MMITNLSKQLFKPFLYFAFLVALSACDNYSPSHRGFSTLDQIKQEGTINILTRDHSVSYPKFSEGLTGFEYDLIMLFANRIDVKVNFITPNDFSDILKKISSNQAHIAAAGLTVTQTRKKNMRFSSTYQSIKEQVIYLSGNKRPKTIADLTKGILEVPKDSSHIESLEVLKTEHPELTWNTNAELNSEALMYLVNEGLIDYTIADSHRADSLKQFYPKLYSAFDISTKRQLAWALPLSNDNSLYNEVNSFFKEISQDKTLKHLLDKYYGNSKHLAYFDNHIFRVHVDQRLPTFISHFKQQAKNNTLDWRLLASIGYQESHWRPKAKSPTGVKGIMMLTKKTAKQMGIVDRTNPAQSIKGGALYFKKLLKIIPQHIPEPDRTWFALASYNVGFGHLEDARTITKQRKGNPDKWLDVKASLPLLAKKKWYKQTKYGYARGNEPVQYVENIRGYYNLLVWLTEENKIEKQVMLQRSQGLIASKL